MKRGRFISPLIFGFLILISTALADTVPADFETDCDVDFNDFNILASSWLTQYGDTKYNPKCDIAEPNGVIDKRDLDVFINFWLVECLCDIDGMVYIPAGTFQMGDSFNEGWSDELPVHAVTLASFYMSKYEITNAQYCTFLNAAIVSSIYVSDGVVYGSGNNQPYCDIHSDISYSQIDYSGGIFSVLTKSGRNMSNDPMVEVSWYGAVAYCNWRSQQEGFQQCYNLSTWEYDFNKKGYRLPTEAEWEYAARGGLSGKRFPWGNTISHTQANYYSGWEGGAPYYSYDVSPTSRWHPLWDDGTYPDTSPVGFFDGIMKYKIDYNWPGSATSYQTTSGSNGYGLYDMVGNVYDWCNDWYSSSYYSSSPPKNPTGPNSGSQRVLRGGSWGSHAPNCRVAHRIYNYDPNNRNNNHGIRVVLDVN